MINRKLKYGEKTVTVNFRCPESKVDEFKTNAYVFLDNCLISNNDVYESKMEDTVIKNTKVSIKKEIVDTGFKDSTVYEYIDSIPLGSIMIEVIGHKVHKHYADEIYYCKLPNGKGFKVVVLNSEKDVKTFIRKELIK